MPTDSGCSGWAVNAGVGEAVSCALEGACCGKAGAAGEVGAIGLVGDEDIVAGAGENLAGRLFPELPWKLNPVF